MKYRARLDYSSCVWGAGEPELVFGFHLILQLKYDEMSHKNCNHLLSCFVNETQIVFQLKLVISFLHVCSC